VGPKESFGDVVWIVVSIDVPVVLAVLGAPPERGVLEGGRPEEEYEQLDGPFRLERLVREQSVVPKSYAHCRGHEEG
jgi:hypothetical protein